MSLQIDNKSPELYLMEQLQCKVLGLIPKMKQSLLIPIQVQKVEVDCRNVGKHLSREQIGDKELTGWTESAENVWKHIPQISQPTYNTYI